MILWLIIVYLLGFFFKILLYFIATFMVIDLKIVNFDVKDLDDFGKMLPHKWGLRASHSIWRPFDTRCLVTTCTYLFLIHSFLDGCKLNFDDSLYSVIWYIVNLIKFSIIFLLQLYCTLMYVAYTFIIFEVFDPCDKYFNILSFNLFSKLKLKMPERQGGRVLLK